MIIKHGRHFLRNSRGAQRYVGFFLLIVLFVAGQANSGDMVCSIHKLRLVVLFAPSSKMLEQTHGLSVYNASLSHIFSVQKNDSLPSKSDATILDLMT